MLVLVVGMAPTTLAYPARYSLKKSMLKVHISLLLRCCIAALIIALWAGRIAAIYFCLNNK